jgi:hypothetical protein
MTHSLMHHLLMVKDLLWQFLRSTTREPRSSNCICSIQIPQQHIPFFATWSQVTANEAKARLLQYESDRNGTLQSTDPSTRSCDCIIDHWLSFLLSYKLLFTLFPRQPMIPEPMHDTSRRWMNGTRLLLAHTEVKMPTICLLLMQLKYSAWVELSRALLSVDTLCESAPSMILFLFNAAAISDFHFVAIQLFLGPSTFLALSGTISWNLKHHKNTRIKHLVYNW